jgi:hypothetical protein
MAKREEAIGEDGDKIRVPMRLTLDERRRLKVLAAKVGRPMEYLAGEWVADRLEREERKHP